MVKGGGQLVEDEARWNVLRWVHQLERLTMLLAMMLVTALSMSKHLWMMLPEMMMRSIHAQPPPTGLTSRRTHRRCNQTTASRMGATGAAVAVIVTTSPIAHR